MLIKKEQPSLVQSDAFPDPVTDEEPPVEQGPPGCVTRQELAVEVDLGEAVARIGDVILAASHAVLALGSGDYRSASELRRYGTSRGALASAARDEPAEVTLRPESPSTVPSCCASPHRAGGRVPPAGCPPGEPTAWIRVSCRSPPDVTPRT